MKRCSLILCVAIVSTSCLDVTGRDRPVKYRASPDGKYKAIILQGKGFVTVRPRWYLQILRGGEPIDNRVSPLAIRLPYYVTAADARSIARIDIQWVSNDCLIASIDSRAEILMGGGDFGNGLRIGTGVPDSVRLVVRTRYESSLLP